MKRRNLSGIFIMYQFEEEDREEPTCFEDCPAEKQDKWLESLDIEALKNLSKMLAETLKEIGDGLDLEKVKE